MGFPLLPGRLPVRKPQKQVMWPPLISPEGQVPRLSDRVFVVANSMREVQPELNVLVSPSVDRIAFKEPTGSPTWSFPEVEERE
jgi:hypothetical protein